MAAYAFPTVPPFECWCIVELMGHQMIAGKVSEDIAAGHALLRVDVPECKDPSGQARPAYTRLINPTSVYAINPCTEQAARKAAASWEVANHCVWAFLEELGRAPDPTEMDEAQHESDD